MYGVAFSFDRSAQAFLAGKYDEAINLYSKAIEEDSKSDTVHSVYANRSAAYAAKKLVRILIAASSRLLIISASSHSDRFVV